MLNERELDRIAQKLLMQEDALYLAKTPEGQSRFRLSLLLNEDKDAQLQDKIEKVLKGQKKLCTKDQWDYIRNSIRLRVVGYGSSLLVINELCYSSDVIKYKTLWDLEMEHQREQEKLWSEDENWVQVVPEFPERHQDFLGPITLWVRFKDTDGLVYGTIMSLYDYCSYYLEELEYEVIQELIPWELISGPEDGKATEFGFIFDKEYSAKGLEKELKELQAYSRSLIATLCEEEAKQSETGRPDIYLNRTLDDPYDRCLDIVVSNIQAAKELKFDNFLYEIQRHPEDEDYLRETKRKLKNSYISKIKDMYNSIMKERKIPDKDNNVVNLFGGKDAIK